MKHILAVIVLFFANQAIAQGAEPAVCDKEPTFSEQKLRILSETYASLKNIDHLGTCAISAHQANLCVHNEFSHQSMYVAFAKHPRHENPTDLMFDFEDYFVGPFISVDNNGVNFGGSAKVDVSKERIIVETLDFWSGNVDSRTEFGLRNNRVVSIVHTRTKTFSTGDREVWNRFACGEYEKHVHDCNNIVGRKCY